MKFSLVAAAAIFGLISSSYATPFPNVDIHAVVERALNDLTDREWVGLEARTGDFANTNKKIQDAAHKFVGDATKSSAMSNAVSKSDGAKTYHSDGNFHLDRQQAAGDHKVAVQLNNAKGGPSTIGQVVLNKNSNNDPKTVKALMNHSINTGKEQHMSNVKTKKQKRMLALVRRAVLEYALDNGLF